jgi:small subunit ribosomal protein S8
MVGDSISNLIISLKNAGLAKKESLSVPYSKMKESILVVLQKNGYIESYEVRGADNVVTKNLHIVVKYSENGTPIITDVKRISKFSKRVYKGSQDIYPIRNGHGSTIFSTPQGILTDKDARKHKVGGEALFAIW